MKFALLILLGTFSITAHAQEFVAQKCQAWIERVDGDKAKELAILGRLEKELPQKLAGFEREAHENQQFIEQKMQAIYTGNPAVQRYYRERAQLTQAELRTGLAELLSELLWGDAYKEGLRKAVEEANQNSPKFKFKLEGDQVYAYQEGKTYEELHGKAEMATAGYVHVKVVDGKQYLIIKTTASAVLPREGTQRSGTKIVNMETGLEQLELKGIPDYAGGMDRKALLSEPFSGYVSRIPNLRAEVERDANRADLTACRGLMKRLNEQKATAAAASIVESDAGQAVAPR